MDPENESMQDKLIVWGKGGRGKSILWGVTQSPKWWSYMDDPLSEIWVTSIVEKRSMQVKVFTNAYQCLRDNTCGYDMPS